VKALSIAAVLLVALPASASAKLRPYVPPGNSGANEYVESVPTAGGDKSTGNVIAAGATGSAAALAPSTQSALTRAGADGRRTAAVANATAPRRARHDVHIAAGSGGGNPGSGASSSQGGASPAGGILSSLLGLHGQGGLGGTLPAILIATMLALGVGRVWRRRAS
jgi:hypothetical protein